MKTVYEADGTPVTLNPIDARERVKVGLAFEKPPGVEVVADGVAIGTATGDGTGKTLPELPVTAYFTGGVLPLVESERPVLSLNRKPPKGQV